MSEIIKKLKHIRMEEFIDIIEEILDSDSDVKILITGGSMYPFLREDLDSVVLSKNYAVLRRGDIVLIKREDGKYVLHRIIKVRNGDIYMAGDAGQRIEGPISSEQVIAGVTSIYRRDKEIPCSSLFWRFLSFAWIMMLPWHRAVIGSYIRMRRTMGRIGKQRI